MPKGDIAIKGGALRHLINILAPVAGAVGTTGATNQYELFAGPIPAAIEPTSAKDIIRTGQTVSEVLVPITIRWLPGMTNSLGVYQTINGAFQVQRLESFRGAYRVVATYIVQGVVNVDERNWKLTLMCLGKATNQ